MKLYLLAQIAVALNPPSATLHIGNQLDFTARVTGTSNAAVTWTASAGSVAANGRYTTPAVLPTPNTVTLTARSAADPAVAASATITLLQPHPALTSVSPAAVPAGAFTLTLHGAKFAPGARAALDGRFLETTFVSANRLTAAGVASRADAGWKPVAVLNPEPGAMWSETVYVEVEPPPPGPARVPAAEAARFLEQASFGPDAASIARVQQLGLEGWLEDQFRTPITPYQRPAAIGLGLTPLQSRFFSNAVHAPDQLRQRVAFALGQIWVVSGTEANRPEKLVPYLDILQRHAFGSFFALMRDITLNPAMGEYLDMVNNDKADPARGIRPNENYAREILQLFTIGTQPLRLDGTPQPGATYDQSTITEFARVFTGWTYPRQPGRAPGPRNPARYIGEMEAWAPNHDAGPKTLLNGRVLPAGQTPEQDLLDALDNIFWHPNVAPFVSKNLIQHLVQSDPSPAYVERVARIFEDNGAGERGDLRAVVRAILLDPEARREAPNSGHLREPALLAAAILRASGPR
jgi:hypothetical protein